jgi:hypothetical protein
MKKWGNELNTAFSKEEVEMDKKHIPDYKGNADQNHVNIPLHHC